MRIVAPSSAPSPRSRPVRYRELFANREFAVLWGADVLSEIGSQVARVAIAALVFARTESAGLTAAAFAITYLPHLLGGAVLASLADRWPRRETLIGADVARAVLTASILVPGMPLLAALGLIFLVELIRIPFGAARLATLADVLDDDQFAAGNGVVAATQQILLVAGFAGGGVLVALIGPRNGLAVDALTYVLSALVLLGLRRRPAPMADKEQPRGLWRDTAEGLRIVRRTPGMLRNITLLLLGPAVLNVTIALALPYAHYLGGGTALAGTMMAAAPLGSAVGLMLVGRLPAPRRTAIAAPSVICLGLAVAATGLSDNPVVIVGLLLVAGLTMGYLTAVQAAIAADTPAHARGRVFGLANTGMQLGQGASVVLAGLLVAFLSLQSTLVFAGLTGVALAAGAALRSRRRVPTQTAEPFLAA